ncbi:hypothetical protein E4U55_004395 [Claviceps digitariae]|nr:hypothetical protein E4U55_004395 [Claviceps digitariae]
MTRSEYARRVQAAMDERRRSRQSYQPQIHEQIERLFSEYEAPFYSRLRGVGRAKNLSAAERTVSAVAAKVNRSLSDTEVQAVTEHRLSQAHSVMLWKWTMTGLAGYKTYIGRRTMRFPFINVIFMGAPSPLTSGPRARIIWHGARFMAYYGLYWLLVEPVFKGINEICFAYLCTGDPRLSSTLRENENLGGSVFAGAAQSGLGQQYLQEYSYAQKPTGSQQQEQQQFYSSSQSGQNYQSTSQAVRAQTQQAWDSSRRQSEPSQQLASTGWDSTDDMDDASPVALSARSQPDSSPTYSGSAWERIRQQNRTGTQSQYGAQTQKTWQGSAQSNTSGAWPTDDEASPQYGGDKDKYSFSTTSDGEDATARRQVQKEFDDLVEREREGAGQERGSWARR